MPNLSKTTIRKMRQVIRAVKANARFLDQGTFPVSEDCGTTCCAAGFTVWINTTKERYEYLAKTWDGTWQWGAQARGILGLEDSVYLFDSASCWPNKFAKMYGNAKTPKGRAAALEACWEHFIKKDGDPYYYGDIPF